MALQKNFFWQKKGFIQPLITKNKRSENGTDDADDQDRVSNIK